MADDPFYGALDHGKSDEHSISRRTGKCSRAFSFRLDARDPLFIMDRITCSFIRGSDFLWSVLSRFHAATSGCTGGLSRVSAVAVDDRCMQIAEGNDIVIQRTLTDGSVGVSFRVVWSMGGHVPGPAVRSSGDCPVLLRVGIRTAGTRTEDAARCSSTSTSSFR